MTTNCCRIGGMARRDVLRAGFGSLAIGAAGLLGRAPAWAQNAANAAPARERILVVLELSGGNDGLNTVVPYGDDAYYRARPAHRHQAGAPAQARRSLRPAIHHGGAGAAL